MIQAFPTFSTERLTFGPIGYQDVHHIFQLFSDPDTMKFDGGQTMSTLDEAQEFIQFYSVFRPEFPILRWAIRDKETGTFYGTGGFYKMDLKNEKAELGGEILKNHWNKGIATEAIKGMLAFGFEGANLNRITALVSPKNSAAQALIKKSGFTYEGCLRQWERWGTEWMDLTIYSLLKKEWQK
ncbi:ribosomal-protein-alanine N-acetyltransferase [Pullulanibacillus pueri]|uniref:Alanine acetyltransferase n=1 Tax=Pullulanibacillus pueri TaxID=1437324 RepID=A0A8J2ZVN7_9BACL|nr:GNAT family protein [Pullulanibacillus pueri]MBM7682304.1 ribosomal-protein-alanine N-acetyltransferase [Pullulanibacillus pueri]GGH80870.1 alanine acetyltransferase [Pullulanibacillus pueri]